ncbi:MAG TPA: hydroxymethylglutaryl-CoA reductase [Thermoanaerobaculia bacterium]|nr:hydroxymethylglutaryl-CoA reductase [Thermoanaerobaculia bacterium]
MKIPSLVLKQLYTFGSLHNSPDGVGFALKNRLSDATLVRLGEVRIDGRALGPDEVRLELDGQWIAGSAVSAANPVPFPLRRVVRLAVPGAALPEGKHEIAVDFEAKPFGRLTLKVQDAIAAEKPRRTAIPYDKENDYAPGVIAERRRFVEEYAGSSLEHVGHYSFDPGVTRGNIENFTGVAQVPIGFAGPINVQGEHAQGEFLVPLATTEGTLVASYNRGIKVLNLSGGVRCTVVGDKMQRAPVFVFDSAREARDFALWVDDHFDVIREHAEATTSVGKLLEIDRYLSNKFVFLRFNYSTGDAAGQNMVGRATFAACSWVLEQHDNVRHFYLESNFATDKKGSQINVMRTRGKRVTAEAVVPRDVLEQHMRVDPETLVYHSHVANVGAFLSGANNNGCHSPNAITAMFIATGQDVANVAESSAGILYAEVTPGRDLYISLTIPSLIVATHGGGTALPTQRECLEVMGCWGRGKVGKLAEIVAGVALAGEISLGSAISSLDWVSSHEKYGRNR